MSFPGLIGQKKGMTQVFNAEGDAVPVTVIELLTLVVSQVKTVEKDGYSAIQVAYTPAKEKHLSRAEQQHLKKNGLGLFRHLQEFRMSAEEAAGCKVGDEVALTGEASFLQDGALVNVTGKSIGKGFQGGTKLWNFSRGPMSHGSKSHRLPGSIGAGTTPGRVFKGLHMAANMGNERVTTSKLEVIRVFPDKNVVLVKGAVPGYEGSFVTLRPKVTHWNANNKKVKIS